jgi:cell division protein FtsL
MYLSTADILGMAIALSVSVVLIIITTIANYQLQQDNRFLKSRLRRYRQRCEQLHVEVPF